MVMSGAFGRDGLYLSRRGRSTLVRFPVIPAAPAADRPPEGRAEVLDCLRAARGRPMPAAGGPVHSVLAVLGGVAPSDFVLWIL